jgi:hypothetical protein
MMATIIKAQIQSLNDNSEKKKAFKDQEFEEQNFDEEVHEFMIDNNHQKESTDHDPFIFVGNPLLAHLGLEQLDNMFIKLMSSSQHLGNSVHVEKDNKISLNVGGKKFFLGKNLFKKLQIDPNYLIEERNNGIISYFLDRDPYYFSNIIHLIKKNDELKDLSQYSPSLLNEMKFYHLIDQRSCPSPKLILKNTHVLIENDSIIKIYIKEQTMETKKSTIAKSPKLMDNIVNNELHVNVDHKLFRYVLNYLRTNELYLDHPDIIHLLQEYQIENEPIVNQPRKLTYSYETKIICPLTYQNMEPFLLKKLPKGYTEEFPAYRRKFYPSCMESMNYLYSQDEINFGKDITFHLDKLVKGDLIEDLLVCIDLPHLNEGEYVKNINQVIIEEVSLTLNNLVISYATGHSLFFHPVVYKNNYPSYHAISQLKPMQMIFNDEIIQLYRLTFPLFFFDSQNPFPFYKYHGKDMQLTLKVKMAPLNQIVKNTSQKVPLLNVSVLCNTQYLSPEQMPKTPVSFIFENPQIIHVTLKKPDMIVLPLDSCQFIKDFYFIIMDQDQELVDAFIFLELWKNNKLIGSYDNILLNQYIPLKKLGHTLPTGVYYLYFIPGEKDKDALKVFSGTDVLLKIKVQEIKGTLKVFINQSIPFISS